MNKRQEQIIERLRKDILLNDGLGEHVNNYEYKKFEVEEILFKCSKCDCGWDWSKCQCKNMVQLITEVGMKSDENILASLLCRSYRQIMITPNGKISLLNAKDRRCNPRTHKSCTKNGYFNAVNCLVV